jgi:hypothetical protein
LFSEKFTGRCVFFTPIMSFYLVCLFFKLLELIF